MNRYIFTLYIALSMYLIYDRHHHRLSRYAATLETFCHDHSLSSVTQERAFPVSFTGVYIHVVEGGSESKGV